MAVLPIHAQDASPRRSWMFTSRLCRRFIVLLVLCIATYWYLSARQDHRWTHGDEVFMDYEDNILLEGSTTKWAPPRPPPPVPQTIARTKAASPWPARAERVKQAFIHAYTSYENNAFPHDELMPLTNKSIDNFNGWGLTAVDALDTMILMGLDDMVDRTIIHIASLRFDSQSKFVPFFETTIRYLGGLLGAYTLNGNPILLSRADDLGRLLLPAFNTTFGLPAYSVNLKSGEIRDGWPGPSVILSEIGSASLEFRALAHWTGRVEYTQAVNGVTEFLRLTNHTDGLFPLLYHRFTGMNEDTRASVGAMADSTYEYFLKGWLQTNKTEDRLRDLYLEAVDGIIEHLLYVSPKRGLLYVTDTHSLDRSPTGLFEHLSCFLAGVLALGHANLPSPPETHLWAAEGLAHTCWITYADMPTGLGADEVVFRQPSSDPKDADERKRYEQGKWKWMSHLEEWKKGGKVGPPPGTGQAMPVKSHVSGSTEYEIGSGKEGYLLRPETVESLFILHRVTRDAKWRERGWQIFEALEQRARVDNGFACVLDVQVVPEVPPTGFDPYLKNEMPSWFLAETLKYFYLLFSDSDDAHGADQEAIPLWNWVFNTEAHPLPVFEWAAWEQLAANITE